MTVEAIDVLQTQQIEDLQDDIEDLAAKINLAVTDVTALTTKINTVITDISNINSVLMGSDPNNQYSPSGATDDDGILKRIDELYAVLWDHIHMPPFSDVNQGLYRHILLSMVRGQCLLMLQPHPIHWLQ